MSDIALIINDLGTLDLRVSGNDLATDDGLESAVLVSLFCDRRAHPEQIRRGDDASDLRGWWGDVDAREEGDSTGSLLWLLHREKQTRQTLTRAEQYAREALQWMLSDRVASHVEVSAEYVRPGVMQLDILIERPPGTRVRYRYDYEWAAQAAKRA